MTRPTTARGLSAAVSGGVRRDAESGLFEGHRTRTAFVFAGGASLGAIEVGMLRALVADGKSGVGP